MPANDHPKLDLLIKLLSKSSTDQDNEALMAVRAANRALAAEGWTWERLLRGRITVVADPFVAMQRPVGQNSFSEPTARPAAPPPPSRAPYYPPRPSPRPQPAAPPKPCTRENLYEGPCYCCGHFTGKRAGFIFQRPNNAKWEIACQSCASFLNQGGAIPPRAVRAKKMSVDDVFNSI